MEPFSRVEEMFNTDFFLHRRWLSSTHRPVLSVLQMVENNATPLSPRCSVCVCGVTGVCLRCWSTHTKAFSVIDMWNISYCLGHLFALARISSWRLILRAAILRSFSAETSRQKTLQHLQQTDSPALIFIILLFDSLQESLTAVDVLFITSVG